MRLLPLLPFLLLLMTGCFLQTALVLDAEITVDGERLATPRLVARPGRESSVRQIVTLTAGADRRTVSPNTGVELNVTPLELTEQGDWLIELAVYTAPDDEQWTMLYRGEHLLHPGERLDLGELGRAASGRGLGLALTGRTR
jgi:hypothetical protein